MIELGVGVFIIHSNKILIGKRGLKCKTGAGLIALPGGMVEDNETVKACVEREIYEETGLSVTYLETLGITDHRERGENRLTLWTHARYNYGLVEVKEPDKCEYWKWMDLDEISTILDIMNTKSEQYFWIPYFRWLNMLKGIIKCL